MINRQDIEKTKAVFNQMVGFVIAEKPHYLIEKDLELAVATINELLDKHIKTV